MCRVPAAVNLCHLCVFRLSTMAVHWHRQLTGLSRSAPRRTITISLFPDTTAQSVVTRSTRMRDKRIGRQTVSSSRPTTPTITSVLAAVPVKEAAAGGSITAQNHSRTQILQAAGSKKIVSYPVKWLSVLFKCSYQIRLRWLCQIVCGRFMLPEFSIMWTTQLFRLSKLSVVVVVMFDRFC